MTDSIKKNTVLYVTEEITEGVYVAPTLGNQAIQVLEDGLEISPDKELVERAVTTGGLGKKAGRSGQRSVSASVPVEFKAGIVDGYGPEYEPLINSCLGGLRSVSEPVIASTIDGATGSATRVPLADLDKEIYSINDLVRVKRDSEVDHLGWVTEVNNTDGEVSITLHPGLASGTFDDGDEVSPVTTYFSADSGQPTLSLTKVVGGNLEEHAIGCRVTSMALENFTTGQIASWNFSLDGLNFDRKLDSSLPDVEYDTSYPPLILQADVFVGNDSVEVNEVSLSIENEVEPKTATNSQYGKVSSRITGRTITGSFNPYKQNDDLSFWTKFTEDTKFDLKLYAFEKDGATGKEQIVGVLIKDCSITDLGEQDAGGMLQDAITFEADEAQIYISYI